MKATANYLVRNIKDSIKGQVKQSGQVQKRFHKKTVTKNAAKYWIPLQKTPHLFLHYRSIPPVFEANGQKCEKAQLRKMGLATAPSNYNPSITKV